MDVYHSWQHCPSETAGDEHNNDGGDDENDDGGDDKNDDGGDDQVVMVMMIRW